jgi:aldose 1-epimerase
MPINQSPFGTMPDGTPVELHTLTNANGLVCRVATYGAVITELHVPDRSGRLGDVVLGFDNFPRYLSDSPCFGAAVGRVANRIARGRFTLDGKTYALGINNPPNNLHGGPKGFDKAVWKAEASESPDGPSIILRHLSPDGDQGFPGALSVRVAYTLTRGNELRIEFEATADNATPVNLTNHSYFNLACGGDIEGHILLLKASNYTPTDETLIPTGEIAPVANTPLDFTKAKPVGRDIGKIPGLKGYDHNLVIDGGGHGLVLAGRVHEPRSGRVMEVVTDQPGVQLYTSNSFDGTLVGKYGAAVPLHAGLCLETQHYPDSVNKPGFPTTILRPGETLRTTTLYRFSAE